jgi:hypothetical protein
MWLRKGEVTVQVAQRYNLRWDRTRKQWFADDSNLAIRDWLAKKEYSERAPKAALPAWSGASDLIPLTVPKKDQATARALGAEKVSGQWVVRKGLGIGRFERWITR